MRYNTNAIRYCIKQSTAAHTQSKTTPIQKPKQKTPNTITVNLTTQVLQTNCRKQLNELYFTAKPKALVNAYYLTLCHCDIKTIHRKDF